MHNDITAHSRSISNNRHVWDAMLSIDKHGRLFSSSKWLTVLSETEAHTANLLIIEREGCVIASCPINTVLEDQSLHYNAIAQLQNGFPVSPVEYAFKRLPEIANIQEHIALFNCAASSFDMRFSKALTSQEQAECFKKMLDYIADRSHAEAMLYNSDFPCTFERILSENGFLKFLVGARYSIPAEPIEGYLSQLPGKKRRSVRYELKQANQPGISYTIEPFQAFITHFLPMVKQNFEKHGFEDVCINFYLKRAESMHQQFKEDMFFIVLRHG